MRINFRIQRRFVSAYCDLLAKKKAQEFLIDIPKRLNAARTGTDKDLSASYWQHLLELSNELLRRQDELNQLKTLLKEDDAGLKAMVESERVLLEDEVDELARRIADAAVPRTELDVLPKCQLEVTAGVGGTEAMLFASELVEMYRNFAAFKGWMWTVMRQDNVQLGGLRSALVAVSGEEAYAQLRFEAGVHRVQRMPITDKTRMHTSTVSVSVLPEPDKIDAYVLPNDVKVETMRASGPGGQNVNKRSTAVRVTHKPSGISVHCMDERFQHLNIQIAFRRLAAILMQQKADKIYEETATARKLQVGSKARAEKVRTYNFKDDRVTDHRLRKSWSGVSGIMHGKNALETIVSELNDAYKCERLEEILETKML
ncbi:putative peptide chain release factor 1, mitochondrial [Toxocara canis]|nr:putative peptide chain release factor 1, mitochondrial [Toxocara canis]